MEYYEVLNTRYRENSRLWNGRSSILDFIILFTMNKHYFTSDEISKHSQVVWCVKMSLKNRYLTFMKMPIYYMWNEKIIIKVIAQSMLFWFVSSDHKLLFSNSASGGKSFDFHCMRYLASHLSVLWESNSGNRDNRSVMSIYRISMRYFVSIPLLLEPPVIRWHFPRSYHSLF